MKATYFIQQGGPEVLTFGDLPDPKPARGEGLIRVRASALNHVDLFRRAGSRGTGSATNEPFVLGCDVAGEIAELGEGVTGLQVGQRVILNPGITCGRCEYCVSGRDNMCKSYRMIGSAVNGGYAQYVKAPQENIHVLRADIDWPTAAAMPLTFLTAYHMLMTLSKLRPGETVLIQAVGSGVGSAALQVARLVGARTIVTAGSDDKLQKAKALGANETINYTSEDFAERVKDMTGGEGVDVVFDHIGASIWEKNFASIKKGGRFVSCGITGGYNAALHMGQMFTKQVSLFGSFMGNKSDMLEVVQLINQGELGGIVDRTFPLEDAQKAHAAMEERNLFGKLVLITP